MVTGKESSSDSASNSHQSTKSSKCKAPLLDKDSVCLMLKTLHPDWVLHNDGAAITREFKFKGFAKAVYMSNLCAWLADVEGHHPDMAYGWGYCRVSLTTHEAGGLSQSDFDWAANLDKLVA